YAGIGRTSLCAITDLAHSITFLSPGNIANYLNIPPESIKVWQLEIRKEVFGLIIAFYPKAEVYNPENNEQIFQFLLKKASLTIENLALYESLMANFYGILRSLVNALEAKDIYTGKHSERVTFVADYLARTMGRPMEELDAINTIGYLHDIGKIGIPDHILNKPGRLSTDEFELIKSHPTIGENIVKELGLSEIERSIIRHHHERWDGKGYPDGIGGEDIPFITRIVTVADAYDAMTTNRPYRKALDKDTVRNEFLRNKGIQFDPQVVEAMFDVFEKLPHEDDNNG
ncbi:MAG: HD-GYP domain-containing protein, partial [Thermodesulforhabdaceae bacterium]